MYTEARHPPPRHARGSPVAIPGTPSEAPRPETPTTSDQARLDAGTTLPALAPQSDSAAVIYSPLCTSYLLSLALCLLSIRIVPRSLSRAQCATRHSAKCKLQNAECKILHCVELHT